MLDIAALALSSLVSRRELRFDPVPEQWAPEACGLAVVAALAPGSREAGISPPDGGLSLADMRDLLGEAGIRTVARRLDIAGLDAALDAGIAPIVLHYDRPDPHWALLLGRSGAAYSLGDPGRGLEILDAEGLSGRFSGAALLPDPATLPGSAKARIDAALRRNEGRAALLAAERGGGAGPSPASRRSVVASARATLADTSEGGRADISLDLRFSESPPGDPDSSLEFGLDLHDVPGQTSTLPRIAFDRVISFAQGFWRLGLGIGTSPDLQLLLPAASPTVAPGPGLGFSLGYLLDPLLVSLSIEAGRPFGMDRRAADSATWARGSLSAVEAFNEVSLGELQCGIIALPLRGLGSVFATLRFSLRTGIFRAGFGWMESSSSRAIAVEASVGSDIGD